MKAWTFQYKNDVAKKGDAASWYTGWVDPDGKRRSKSFGPGDKGKSAAERHAVKIEDRIASGRYENKATKTWAAFRAEYDEQIIGAMTELRSAEAAKLALDTFGKKMKPGKMAAIKSQTVDKFIKLRMLDDGYGGRKLSKATINKELRYLRAALRVAHEWEYLPKVPRFKFFKLAEKLPTFIPPEDFAKLYQACGQAKLPGDVKNVSAENWWKGLLMLGYMTGWRIGQLLALKWADVDLGAGVAISRAADNKGKRDMAIDLHPVAVEHVRKLEGSKLALETYVFPWNHSQRPLWTQFYKLQEAAKVKPSTKDRYGFHDIRRAFATMNAAGMDLFTLQRLMQHKSIETTKL
ncbi:MAG: hypothetical protein B7Z73_17935, partial [Planctomycetia bacterium 21-64-5]